MSVEFALLLWLLVVIGIFFVMRNFRITWWSSLVGALIIGWIVLVFAYPWGFDVSTFSYKYSGGEPLIGVISMITILLTLIYVIQKIFTDREQPRSY